MAHQMKYFLTCFEFPMHKGELVRPNFTSLLGSITAPLLLMGIMSAPTASAAATPSTIYISPGILAPELRDAPIGGGSLVPSLSWTSEFDTLTIVNERTGSVTISGLSGGTTIWGPVVLASGNTYTVNPLGLSLTAIRFDAILSTLLPATAPTGGGSETSTTDSPLSGPPPILQQFGMPASGDCHGGEPTGLNWSGVSSGGWGVSWAQWANDSEGGAVCTRMLVYSTEQSKWIIGR
jgi:hypothetical protein